MFELGQMVGWTASNGYHSGKIVKIIKSLNAAHKMIEWIAIKGEKGQLITMANTEQNAAMMKMHLI